MNVIGVLIFAGLVWKSVLAQETPQNTSKIVRFLYDRCRVYSTEASAYDEVKKHLGQFSDYLSYTASLLPKGKEQFCNDERSKLTGLMKQLAIDLKPCFPKDEKYLPKFMYESFVEFINFVCAERNIENFFSTPGNDCRANFKQTNAGEEVAHCFKRVFTIFDDVVKKDELCQDLKSAQTCFGEALTKHCPDFKGYESLNKKFFSAIRKPCSAAPSSATFVISSLALIFAAFISIKVF